MAYGPGVNEINYADLPPTGDTVNSAFQKTQNQLDTLYTGLNNDIVRASEAEVNAAIDTTKLITPGTLLKGKVNGVASLDALGKVTGTELPDASETTKGIMKVGDGLSATEGVVSVVSASETVKGIIELATPAEVLAGEDDERSVTPAGFKAGLEASYPTLDSDRIYDGVNLETKFAAEIAGYSDVWAWVKARAQAGNFIGLHVGDYVQFTVGADTVQAQIAGMDTYYKTGDSELGHHIDFISRDCLTATYKWNTTNINNGNGTNAAPWMVSALKASLDGLVTSLPAGLQSVVVTKLAMIETRYTSGSTLTDSTLWDWNNMGKLWVPSEFEVFGTIVWGTRGYSQNGGVQYPIFGNSWKNRIKGLGHNGERTSWWLSSVCGGNSTTCCRVSYNGSPSYYNASGALRVPLCFRIS